MIEVECGDARCDRTISRNDIMIDRRTLLGAALGACALIGLPAAQAAELPYDDKGDPFKVSLDLNNAVLDRIRGDKSLKSGDIEAVRKLVDGLIMPAVDFTMMTRMTVGPKWRSATDEQRKALEEGFELLLMRVYSGALANVTDQRVELRPTRSKAIRDEMVIRTLMKGSGTAQPVGLDYRIYRAKEKTWKIVDVNIEGIWMVENYRSQFASILNQEGVDGLIRQFKEKGESLAASMKSPGAKE